MRRSSLLALLLAGLLRTALAHEGPAIAHYLANEGVLVSHGATRILFDPLFRESFGQYRLLPAELRTALFAGQPPFDDIDAVFISHYHDDHFHPADMLEFLRERPAIRLYAPRQAAQALLELVGDDAAIAARVTAVSLAYGDSPLRLEAPGLQIDAVRIPHSGWPTARLDIENIAWRVTLDDGPTVLHLGDADTRDVHFSRDEDHWEQRDLHMAFPPYWYFLSTSGRQVLEERLRPWHAVGIHVPVDVPDDANLRPEPLRRVDLFTRPGETRRIAHESGSTTR